MWSSLLFVQILNNRLVEGAATRGADAVVLDLEAAIPQDRKDEARAALSGAVSGLEASGADIAVRVNPLHSGGVNDIAMAIDAGVDLIVLPHATSTAAKQAADLAGATPLILLIESPRGVIDALAIAEAASTIVGLRPGRRRLLDRDGAPPNQNFWCRRHSR